MPEKSYVGMGHTVCPICTKKHNSTILIDKRLRNTLTNDMVTDIGLCDEHQELYDKGYIALVAIDEEKSELPFNLDNVYRTGKLAHISQELFEQIFDVPVPDNPARLMMCPDDLIDKLQTLQPTE